MNMSELFPTEPFCDPGTPEECQWPYHFCKCYRTKQHLPVTSLFKINLWFLWVDYRLVRMNLEKTKVRAPLTPVYWVPFHPLGKPKAWPVQGWSVFRITVTWCLTTCSEHPPTVVGSWPRALRFTELFYFYLKIKTSLSWSGLLFTPCHSLHAKMESAELPSLSRETISEEVESGSGTGCTPHSKAGEGSNPCWFSTSLQWHKMVSRQDPGAPWAPLCPLSANPRNSAGYGREKGWRCRKKALRARRMESRPLGCWTVKVTPQGCSRPPTLWPLILLHPEEKSVLEAFLPIGGGMWTHTGHGSLHREKFLEALFLKFKQISHHALSSTESISV